MLRRWNSRIMTTAWCSEYRLPPTAAALCMCTGECRCPEMATRTSLRRSGAHDCCCQHLECQSCVTLQLLMPPGALDKLDLQAAQAQIYVDTLSAVCAAL